MVTLEKMLEYSSGIMKIEIVFNAEYTAKLKGMTVDNEYIWFEFEWVKDDKDNTVDMAKNSIGLSLDKLQRAEIIDDEIVYKTELGASTIILRKS